MSNQDKILTTKELAKYIKLNEKTVLKQAQDGKLPGVKIGNQWRFHLSAIDEYLHETVEKMADRDLDEIINTAAEIIPLSRLTGEKLIELDLKASNQKELLIELSLIAQKKHLCLDAKLLQNELHKREKMLSTALGNEIAIPHPRNPIPGMFANPNIIIARSKDGINFGAPDHKKTKLFFLICATNSFVHLRLLAKITKLLHSEQARKGLLLAKKKNDAIKVLLEFERNKILPLSQQN